MFYHIFAWHDTDIVESFLETEIVPDWSTLTKNQVHSNESTQTKNRSRCKGPHSNHTKIPSNHSQEPNIMHVTFALLQITATKSNKTFKTNIVGIIIIYAETPRDTGAGFLYHPCKI